MPIYEFHCRNCHEDFEVIMSTRDAAGECPHCQSRDTERIVSFTHYRNADHWEKDMLNGLALSKEKDQMKAEMKKVI
jgi:putative FmdB family regulatory protein